MAKLRPEDNAKPYRPEDYSPVAKGFKPNRFALQRHVAPEDVQITTALDLYFHEHLHRTPAVVCQMEKTIVDFSADFSSKPLIFLRSQQTTYVLWQKLG